MSDNHAFWKRPLVLYTCLLGFVCQTLLLFPGIYSPDSIDQFNQAITGDFSDWHPPIMALFWRAQINVFRSELLFYALHIAGFWLALYLSVRNFPPRWWVSAFALLLGFAPFTLNFLGVVWKDVSLGVSATLAAALVLDARLTGRTITPSRGLTIGLLLCYAALVRINGAFLISPLVLALMGKWNKPLSWQPIASIALAFFTILVAPMINQRVIGARASGANVSLQVFDLGGISHFSKTNLLPGTWSSNETERIVSKCYDGMAWDVYAWGECDFVIRNIDKNELSKAWIGSIIHHPAAYVIHRFTYYNNFSKFFGTYLSRDFVYAKPPAYPNSGGVLPINSGHRILIDTLNIQNRMIWFTPYFWLIISIMLFICTYNGKNVTIQIINAISFGSIIYMVAYLPFGVASDFRYCFPSILLLLVSYTFFWNFYILDKGSYISLRRLKLLAIPLSVMAIGFLF